MTKHQRLSPEQKAANQKERARLNKIEQVYTAIAQLLPGEGRDYVTTVTVSDETGDVGVSMRGLTPIGTTFAQHCMTELPAQMAVLGNVVRDKNASKMQQLKDALKNGIRVKGPGGKRNDGRTKHDGTGRDATASSDASVDTEEHVL